MNESGILDQSIQPLVDQKDGPDDLSKSHILHESDDDDDIEIKKDEKDEEDLNMLNLESPGRRPSSLTKERKEVDFHHKVAYRFEKAYRLSKKGESLTSLNKEIINCIRDN